MKLILKLQDLYARYLSIDMKKNIDYSLKPGLKDIQRIVSEFPSPTDDIERAYFQYKCSIVHLSKINLFLINTAAAILIIPYLIRLYGQKINYKSKANAVFLVAEHISDMIIPTSLRERYPITCRMVPGESMCLDKTAKRIIKDIIKRFPTCPFFILKIIIKLGILVASIETYKPEAIIHNTESSFACSILTHYCESRDIAYLGVMHGEYLPNPKDAFFRCTNYYVWDGHYRNMLSSIGCEKEQFVIEKPPCLILDRYSNQIDKEYDYTFYLQKETPNEMKTIVSVIKLFVSKGYRVSVRPHPKFFDKSLFVSCIGEGAEGFLENCSLEESLSKTKHVVGRFSTVLYQAYLKGVEVVLDDVSNETLTEYLERADYIMLHKPHKMLSQALHEIEKG